MTVILLTIGTIFMLVAGLGLVRMPDLFLRMSAGTKGTTLGVLLIMLAVAVHFGDLGTVARALGIAVFLMITAPVAAHLIGRAAYIDGTPLWSGTAFDDLREQRTSQAELPDETNARNWPAGKLPLSKAEGWEG